jgi:hypothetical protein
MALASHWMELKEKVIDGLKKDNEDLRGVVKDKEKTIRLMTHQLRDAEDRVRMLESDLKFAKALADLHRDSFHMAIGIARTAIIDPEAPCP